MKVIGTTEIIFFLKKTPFIVDRSLVSREKTDTLTSNYDALLLFFIVNGKMLDPFMIAFIRLHKVIRNSINILLCKNGMKYLKTFYFPIY